MSDGFRLQNNSGLSPASSLNAMLALGLQTEGAEEFDHSQPGEKPGDFIRNYRLIDLLGEGGFGTVWRAQQLEPVQRELALKLIKPGMSSRSIVARFEAERQALAMMDHPNIAAVLDAGVTSDGRSFFAMELVRGVPLTAFCDENHLTLRERIELFLPVCHAVQHAHQKGIIHRDLKPSNILVAKCDGKAVPKVIDFGVAKALGSTDLPAFQASMLYTQIGTVVGTLQYMSPEQAGRAQDVDTRSDIYTLGIILYELLTGNTPFQPGQQGVTLAFDEALRQVRESQIGLPSNLHFSTKLELTRLAGLRQLAPLAFKRQLRGDLDWITLRALEKDRARRYPTVAAMAEDLQRWLEGQPVSAVAPSWGYQFSRFARRNRLVLTTACIVSLALLAGTGISIWQASQAQKARAAAEASRALAEEKSREAEMNLVRARAAVETYLSSVTTDPKLSQSDFSDLRKELLKKALPIYEEMLKGASDPGLRGEHLVTQLRLGNLYQSQGDYAKSTQLHFEAMKGIEELLAADPDNFAYLRMLQSAYSDMGALYNEMGEPEKSLEMLGQAAAIVDRCLTADSIDDYCHECVTVLNNLAVGLELNQQFTESEARYARALEIQKQLIARRPDEPNERAQLGACYGNLARMYYAAGRNEEAVGTFRQAIGIAEDLMKEHPENPGHPHFLGSSNYGLGVLLSQNDPAASLACFNRTVELYNVLTQEFPREPNYRELLSKTHYAIGNSLIRLERKAEAMAEFQISGRLSAELVRDYPGVPAFSGMDGVIIDRQALLKAGDGQWEEARPGHELALERFRTALAMKPSNPVFQTYLRTSYRRMADIFLEGGKPDEAIGQARDLAKLESADAEALERAASVFARAIPLFRPDLADREARIEECRSQAVALLKQSIMKGGAKAPQVADLDDYRSLNGYSPFKELLQSDETDLRNAK